jgi:hypothetical protein
MSKSVTYVLARVLPMSPVYTLAQSKVTKRKCAPADARFAGSFVNRCLVAPLDTAHPGPGLV